MGRRDEYRGGQQDRLHSRRPFRRGLRITHGGDKTADRSAVLTAHTSCQYKSHLISDYRAGGGLAGCDIFGRQPDTLSRGWGDAMANESNRDRTGERKKSECPLRKAYLHVSARVKGRLERNVGREI